MSTTTTDSGDAPASEPQESAAVTTDGQNADQVITTDDNGTPTLAPVTSQSEESAEAAPEEPEGEPEAQATAETPEQEFDVEAYAKKKGIDLSKADPKTLVKMQYEAEKKMHEATAKAKELETATVAQAPLDYTGDPNIDALAQQVTTLRIKDAVNDFFNSNPEAREYESKMAEIVTNRPHLQNDLDALYALAKNDPSREAEIKQAGGREALTNLAQKQSAIPPGANATNSGVYQSNQITPNNVYDLIEKNSQEWFEKNHDAINKAISGK